MMFFYRRPANLAGQQKHCQDSDPVSKSVTRIMYTCSVGDTLNWCIVSLKVSIVSDPLLLKTVEGFNTLGFEFK